MLRTANREELEARALQIRHALIGAALAALFFVILAILLLDPSSGIADVHVPSDGRDLLFAYPGKLPAGEPYVVNQGIGRVGQILSSVIQTSLLGAAGLLIWALVKRRKPVTYAAIFWLVLISYAGPVPTFMQPTPPISVSVPVARTALGVTGAASSASAREMPTWRRYMLAQVAYAEGDRAGAVRLSSRISSEDIASPIEGAYRLQFLQGHPPTVTSACFKFGCLTPPARWWAEIAAFALALLAACLTIAAWQLLRTVRRRLASIEQLTATGRLRRATA
ncbi:MAG: hypothetical protein JWN66_2457 [Sphingomonas bacterium]|uniref:hypothetical protein n=1 Tax=Sphingomonas bacterium TaxID=1895847 RepID=UPI00260F0328|nr:hypothetical protein [Sphingomonas bacterium]MDB5705341.1 hypothetical protein [Sphingomonas bacterium]